MKSIPNPSRYVRCLSIQVRSWNVYSLFSLFSPHIQLSNRYRRKILQQTKRNEKVNTRANSFHDRSLVFCDFKNVPSCLLQYTWYLVLHEALIICIPTRLIDLHNSLYYRKPFIEIQLNKIVDYPNDPPGSCSVCKPCLLYTSPSPRDQRGSRMPSSA